MRGAGTSAKGELFPQKISPSSLTRRIAKLLRRPSRSACDPHSHSMAAGTKHDSLPGIARSVLYETHRTRPSAPPPPPPQPTTKCARKEKPRPVKAALSTTQPHKCAHFLACISRIEDLRFHRRRLSQLNAAATDLGLRASRGSGDLRFYRLSAEDLARDLAVRGVDPMDVLSRIQSPEYWEAEHEYLSSHGCLEDIQGPPESPPYEVGIRYIALSDLLKFRSTNPPLHNTENLIISTNRNRWGGTKRKASEPVEDTGISKRTRGKSSKVSVKSHQTQRQGRTTPLKLPFKPGTLEVVSTRQTRSRLDLRGQDIRRLGL